MLVRSVPRSDPFSSRPDVSSAGPEGVGAMSEDSRFDALDEFHKRIDDVILLAIAAAGDQGINVSDFLDREVLDALARLSERGFIERTDNG